MNNFILFLVNIYLHEIKFQRFGKLWTQIERFHSSVDRAVNDPSHLGCYLLYLISCLIMIFTTNILIIFIKYMSLLYKKI